MIEACAGSEEQSPEKNERLAAARSRSVFFMFRF
jgi:hypothetical protein